MSNIGDHHRLTVHERGEMLLDTIFGKDEDRPLEEPFGVFESGGNDVGKIYLPITQSLDALGKSNLPFKWRYEVRETKVVIHY